MKELGLFFFFSYLMTLQHQGVIYCTMNPNYEENSCNLRKYLVSSYENCYKIKADDKKKRE